MAEDRYGVGDKCPLQRGMDSWVLLASMDGTLNTCRQLTFGNRSGAVRTASEDGLGGGSSESPRKIFEKTYEIILGGQRRLRRG